MTNPALNSASAGRSTKPSTTPVVVASDCSSTAEGAQLEETLTRLQQHADRHERLAKACSHMPIQRTHHEVARDAYYTAIEIVRSTYKHC